MANYEVKLFTSDLLWSTTLNCVYIKLVGIDGESERSLVSGSSWFAADEKSHFTLTCPASIGKLILIELDKQTYWFPNDDWCPMKVTVTCPEGIIYSFPVYHWITDDKECCFREGTALRVCDEDNSHGKNSRKQELEQRDKEYCWSEYKEGLPHCLMMDVIHPLPPDVHFSFTKNIMFQKTALISQLQTQLSALVMRQKKWTRVDEINKVFSWKTTKISEYVRDNWKEDALFGYQFLNGVNPMMIQRCNALPSNFPVTDDMVFPDGQNSLADEMEKGNIFLCDYKILDGVETNIINGKEQYLMAPLVLFQKTPENKLLPIAIQLKQQPGEDNPIFLPTDSEYDWLVAKIFVRSADFNVHELDVHLLRTHLLCEVFTVSLLRNVPMVHPLYKLLIPHTRYTLQINVLARERLISEVGVLTQFTASGGKGMHTILRRSLSTMTYRSLCIPDDIEDRGLKEVPNFYYKEDGLRLWKTMNRFVKGILSYYYKNDDEVQKDTELQKWIKDIFEHGFLSQTSTGIPQKFTTLDELIKFVTMVIFTGSAQHAAVNSGQYDFGGWMPNSPPSLQRPPPTKKGEVTEATMLEMLPDINVTAQAMNTLWLLSKKSSDFVPLGHYPSEHFTEETPKEVIQKFQGDLMVLSTKIQFRNSKLKTIPYTYLDPTEVENSVSI